MSYVLATPTKKKLEAPLADIDPSVVRVDVRMGSDHDGDEVLFFEVVLSDDAIPAQPSAEFGRRLQRISAALRQRASATIPQAPFAHVRFLSKSDAKNAKRRGA